jgi:hypothetical protein
LNVCQPSFLHCSALVGGPTIGVGLTSGEGVGVSTGVGVGVGVPSGVGVGVGVAVGVGVGVAVTVGVGDGVCIGCCAKVPAKLALLCWAANAMTTDKTRTPLTVISRPESLLLITKNPPC